VIGQSILERDDGAAPGLDLDDDDYEGTDGIDFRLGRRAGPRTSAAKVAQTNQTGVRWIAPTEAFRRKILMLFSRNSIRAAAVAFVVAAGRKARNQLRGIK
jgi:hypothetical protein